MCKASTLKGITFQRLLTYLMQSFALTLNNLAVSECYIHFCKPAYVMKQQEMVPEYTRHCIFHFTAFIVKFMLDRVVGVAMIRVLSKSYQASEKLHKKLVSQWAQQPNLSMYVLQTVMRRREYIPSRDAYPKPSL